MEYMGNSSYWDRKFENRGLTILPPENLLLRDVDSFHFNGCGLEVACGDGRNLVPLAKKGFDMTGIDFSTVAMERLKNYAKDSDVKIKLYQEDLSELS